MKKVFALVAAVSALCVATPLFAHHGMGPRGGGYGHDYDRDYYDHDYYDHGYNGGGYNGNGCGWCLGSDWCRSQPPGHQHSDRCYFYYDPRDPGQVPPPSAPMPRRPRDVSRGFGAGVWQGKVAFGTVSSVDKDASTLTLTNADNEDVLVHVSPFTRLVLPAKAPAADSTSRVIGPVPPPSVADIPTGSFAMVRAFDTDTKTLEAARVVVIPAS